MVIEKRKLSQIFFIIYLILVTGFFHLADKDGGRITDIGLCFGFVFLLVALRRFSYGGLRYRNIMLFALLLSITSALASTITTGQPFFMGLRPQRQYIVAWIMYLAISQEFTTDSDIQWLIKTIKACSYIQLTLYIVQFFLADRVVFLQIDILERYGTPRLYGSMVFISLHFLFALSEQIKSEKLLKQNVFDILLIISYIAFIRKGRMITIVFIGMVVVALMLWRGAKSNKIIILVVGLWLMSFYLTDAVIESFMSAISSNSAEASVLVRDSAKDYYLTKLMDNPIMGMGYINTDYPRAAKLAGIGQGYLVVDNGVYGYLYQYGILGGLWCAVVLLKLILDGIRMSKISEYLPLLFCIFSLLGMQSGHWISYMEESLMLVIVCFYSDYIHREFL